jgi:hypothetical protein
VVDATGFAGICIALDKTAWVNRQCERRFACPYENAATIIRGDFMKAQRYVRRDAKQRGMPNRHCPNCNSSEIVPQIVNDLLRAVDPRGKVFEVGLQLPVWRCSACKLCWQGQEALAAKEAAYQYAIARRSTSQLNA